MLLMQTFLPVGGLNVTAAQPHSVPVDDRALVRCHHGAQFFVLLGNDRAHLLLSRELYARYSYFLDYWLWNDYHLV